MANLEMPQGYWFTHGRNEYREPCVVLHHVTLDILGDFDCEAEAIFAAQEHADALADEASAEAAAAAGGAYEATLDTIHAWLSGLVSSHLPGDDAARGEQRAVREAIAAIQAIGKAPAAAQIARAA